MNEEDVQEYDHLGRQILELMDARRIIRSHYAEYADSWESIIAGKVRNRG